MATTQAKADAPKDELIVETKTASVADIALDDWAASKSRQLGRRVEALSAFYKHCQRTGCGRATVEQFEQRFEDFRKQPVGGAR